MSTTFRTTDVLRRRALLLLLAAAGCGDDAGASGEMSSESSSTESSPLDASESSSEGVDDGSSSASSSMGLDSTGLDSTGLDSSTSSEPGTTDSSSSDGGNDSMPQSCGDGTIDDDEVCDDGNAIAADGCELDCTPTIAEIVAGGNNTCARTHAGALRCWGSSWYAQLGYGDNENVGDDETPADVGDVDVGQPVAQVVIGEGHICALLDDGSVRCWGRNDQGQCGYGHDEFLTHLVPSDLGTVELDGTAVALTTSSNHTCALLDDGAVRCWGRNGTAQLGLGHTENIGDDEKPGSQPAVDVGGDVVQIAALGNHTCALLDGGAVRCWGLGSEGRLGYGNTLMIGDDELPSSAGDINLGITAVQIGGGTFHTCVRGDNGNVRCFGDGLDGALGYGSFEDIGDDEVPAQVGNTKIGTGVEVLASGAGHNCVVTDLATVRCWGRDNVHQLGLPGGVEDIGDDEPPSVPFAVEVGGSVVQLALGRFHSCALLEHGAVRCWGDGTHGALGYGNAVTIGDDETPADAGDVPVF